MIGDVKNSFNKGDSMVRKLILVNIAGFLFLNFLNLAEWATQQEGTIFSQIQQWLYLPASPREFVYKPWTVITYMFAHEDFFHLLFNMLWLYFLGGIFKDFLGNRRLLQTYFWGGISGGLLFILLFNVLPVLRDSGMYHMPLLGASAAVLAVVTGIATLVPNYQIRLFMVLDIKLKYIAVAAAILSLLAVQGSNPGGNIAHLGGIIFGFVYVKYFSNYTFIDAWGDRLRGFFNKRTAPRKPEKKYTPTYTIYSRGETDHEPDQEEIDAILDKISSSGYDSLTKAEKELLFKASQQH